MTMDSKCVSTETEELVGLFTANKSTGVLGTKGPAGVRSHDIWSRRQGMEECSSIWKVVYWHWARDWERNRNNSDIGTDLYFWLGRKEDYIRRYEILDELALWKFLQDKRPLESERYWNDREELMKLHDAEDTVIEKILEFVKSWKKLKVLREMLKVGGYSWRRSIDEVRNQYPLSSKNRWSCAACSSVY